MKLKYGVTIVSVPRSHVLGRVERPRFRYFKWQYEPEKDEDHFRIKSLSSLARAEFVDRLRSDANSVLLFVHGYDVTFQDAVFKAAQIAYDANFGGSVLVFSWPSAGELLKYDYDRESAEFSGGDLLQVLRVLTEEIGDKRVYIVAQPWKRDTRQRPTASVPEQGEFENSRARSRRPGRGHRRIHEEGFRDEIRRKKHDNVRVFGR
jgi:esterase/lipase superfamily enzyme